MLYNIKTLPLHCVFHGIRFKVNEDWVSVIDTLLFFCVFSSFFFCPNKRKTKQKENSPSAFFYLLQHFSPLNKKNSLRSNSFLFLTLHKAPPLHGKKVRPNLDATLLRSLRWVFFYMLCFYLLFRTELNVVKTSCLGLFYSLNS